MKSKVIMFDVDGVLADFVAAFTTLANEMFGTPIITTMQQQSWSFCHDGGAMTHEQETAAWAALKQDPCWWIKIPALISDESFERIRSMQTRHEVVFVTNRYSTASPPGWQTKQWLSRYGLGHASVLVTAKKGEVAHAIGANFSIEDKLENAWCIHWFSDSPQTASVILDRPYNRLPEKPQVGAKLVRVYSVSEFLDYVEGERHDGG